MTQQLQFKGTATLSATIASFAGRQGSFDIAFGLRLEDSGVCHVLPADFVLTLTADQKSPDLNSVTLKEAAQGALLLSTGQMFLEIVLKFNITGPDSELELRLETDASHTLSSGGKSFTAVGQAADKASGQLVLAALGKFCGGGITKRSCMLSLQGVLTPNPWA